MVHCPKFDIWELAWISQQFADQGKSEIAHRILRYLSIEDLWNTRLVNKQWEVLSRPHFSSLCVIYMDSLERIESFTETFRSNPDFFRKFIITGHFPFTTSIYRFFANFGPYMTMLMLIGCDWIGTEMGTILEKTPEIVELVIVGEISPKDCLYPCGSIYRSVWPRLNTLHLDLRRKKGDHHGDYCRPEKDNRFQCSIQVFVEQILRCAPNLSKIVSFPNASIALSKLTVVGSVSDATNDCFFNPSIYSPCRRMSKVYLEEYACFRKLLLHTILFRSDVPLPNLSFLEFPPEVSFQDREIKLLEMRHFPLARLEMEVHLEVGLLTLHSLLKSVSPTLKYLTLRFLNGHVPTAHFFPSSHHLVHLDTLNLISFRGPLNFIHCLASLRELTLIDVCLKEIFTGPDGHPIILPPEFGLGSMQVVQGGYRITKCMLPSKDATFYEGLKELYHYFVMMQSNHI